ncbi:MAG TPA: hypothetical protein VFB72_17855 [Verrucomicrobiae bacterium]|nr:hypothetical protein [Verrucomicrobiae bacterium]
MKNILSKQSFKLICCLVIAAFASVAAMPALAGYNGTSEPPHAAVSDGKWHKTEVVTNWGPSTTIQNVTYNDLPLSEVAQNLKEVFKDQFDVLLPPGGLGGSLDYQRCTVKLELKNVTAAEIFNAMNLIFETGNTPFRWDLMMNGNRPTALLRTLADKTDMAIDPTTGLPLAHRPPEKPMVFFVGDLTDNSVEGSMTLDQVLKTVQELCASSNVPVLVSGHQEAELLVARGTDSDLKFVEETLAALRQKVKLDGERKAEAKRSKTNATSKP